MPSLSELSVCSGSVEKSESSVPSELLPAFLYNTTEPAVSTKALNLLHCIYATRTHRNKTPLDAKLVKSPTPGVFKVGCGAWGHGSAGDIGGKGWLDEVMVGDFSNINDFVIL